MLYYLVTSTNDGLPAISITYAYASLNMLQKAIIYNKNGAKSLYLTTHSFDNYATHMHDAACS